MRNIQKMIEKANAATGAQHRLCVEWDETEWLAAIVEVADASYSEVITLESDWDTDCSIEGATVSEAVERLDAICARDFV